ncbi:hypothetical protein H0H87_008214, partial [Tephrocybe sp. NHM501043]
MSGDFAWKFQVRVTNFLSILSLLNVHRLKTQINSVIGGRSILGIFLASDKTPLTVGMGNREMHPLLISIANIKASVRMKASSHAFALVGYLPIPKFPDDYSADLKAALIGRLFHFCIKKITRKLQAAMVNPVKMSDGDGHICSVVTPLVSHIADWPEQRMISCVAASASPISLAKATEFGDSTQHPRRTRTSTLQLIESLCAVHHPWAQLDSFIRASKKIDLLGVHQPYWRDWGVAAGANPALVGPFTLDPDWGAANPSLFLTPDALHAWHKFFFNHVIKWIMNIIGVKELDYHLSIQQHHIGTRSWPNGISKLKQLTGREHRELEKIIIAAAGDALPDTAMEPICSLLDFIFQAQNLVFYDETVTALRHDLAVFHHFKDNIGSAGGCRGNRGPIGHWNIPKIKLMHSVADSVVLLGAPHQWTSDVMERCHITHVKVPYRSSNCRDFERQCVRYLDHAEK